MSQMPETYIEEEETNLTPSPKSDLEYTTGS
jgi:hypothetical protein